MGKGAVIYASEVASDSFTTSDEFDPFRALLRVSLKDFRRNRIARSRHPVHRATPDADLRHGRQLRRSAGLHRTTPALLVLASSLPQRISPPPRVESLEQ